MFGRKRKDQSRPELPTAAPKHRESLEERRARLRREDQARFNSDGLPRYVLLPMPDGVRIVDTR